MADQAGRGLLPGIASLGQTEAEVVKLTHIDRVEGLRAGVDKIGRDVSKVVVHVVAFVYFCKEVPTVLSNNREPLERFSA